MMASLSLVAKNNGDGTYDAEIALTILGTDSDMVHSEVIKTTQQRTVCKGLASRELAIGAASFWVRQNLFPVVEKLAIAKP